MTCLYMNPALRTALKSNLEWWADMVINPDETEVMLSLRPDLRMRVSPDTVEAFSARARALASILDEHATFEPSCTADEIILAMVADTTAEEVPDDEITGEWIREALAEDLDVDFLCYLGANYDGIETSDIAEMLGFSNMSFDEWFVPFVVSVTDTH